MSTLASALDRVPGTRAVVVGDLILDHYVWGAVDRISPEAPVPVLRILREETRPGGAGSVLSNLASLDALPLAVSVVGGDAAGDELVSLLRSRGVDVSGVARANGRATTQKTRHMARVQQMLRVDRDVDAPLGDALEAALERCLLERLDGARVVLVSDYGKGVLEGRLARRAAEEARRLGIPCLVDPFRHAEFSRYRGATCATPNRQETENATGVRPRDAESHERAAEVLCERLDLDWAAITLDRDGIYLKRRGGPRGALYPAKARAVYDVTGAGDMVLSVLGAVVGSGGTFEDAVRLANVASGLEVEKVGVASIPRAEILREVRGDAPPALARKIVSKDELKEKLAEARRQGRSIVFTNGCFDLLHAGHVRYFQECRNLGDVLVVGLNTDRSIRELKGAGRPILALDERATVLAGLAAVDYVAPFDEATPRELIAHVGPNVDVLVKGEDYRGKEVVGSDLVRSWGGRVELVPLVPGLSTTEIVERVLDAAKKSAGAPRRAP